MKLPGVISLRNALPICAMPNGGLRRENWSTFLKLTKIPCAVSGRRKMRAASSRTGPMNVSNIRLNCRASPSSPPHCGTAQLAVVARLEVVGAPALLALAQALDERVGEALDVPRRLPRARVHQDRGVERDHVVALLDVRPPPLGLDVVLQQDPVVAVVVGRGEAAVDLRGLEDEAAPLAQGDDLLHGHGVHVGVVGAVTVPSCRRFRRGRRIAGILGGFRHSDGEMKPGKS